MVQKLQPFPLLQSKEIMVVTADQHLPTSSESVKPESPTPSTVPDSFYQRGSKSNLSGILGGYASSIRAGRKSGHSTPGTKTPVEALRAMMMFGGPAHRLQSQMMSAA
jgi:hypothetical protein